MIKIKLVDDNVVDIFAEDVSVDIQDLINHFYEVKNICTGYKHSLKYLYDKQTSLQLDLASEDKLKLIFSNNAKTKREETIKQIGLVNSLIYFMNKMFEKPAYEYRNYYNTFTNALKENDYHLDYVENDLAYWSK